MVHELLIVMASLGTGSVIVVYGLRCPSLWHMESSQSRDKTHVLYIGREILNQWAAREVSILLNC